MKAWHNNPQLKAEVLSRMLQHRADDTIVQGHYQLIDPQKAMGYRGCLIGCTLPLRRNANGQPIFLSDQDWHYDVEDLYGIPVEIGILLDNTFERLPVEKAPWFAVTFIEATPVGANMDDVVKQLKQDFVDRFFGGEAPVWAYINDPDYLADLVSPDPRGLPIEERNAHFRAEYLWVAEQIIKRVQEADPNPYVQPIIPATVEETRVPVAA